MKVLKTALLFLMCVSFSFSCKEGVKEVRVLKLAHGLPPSHSVHLGLLYMNERLKSCPEEDEHGHLFFRSIGV